MSHARALTARSLSVSSVFLITLWGIAAYLIDTMAFPSPIEVAHHLYYNFSPSILLHLSVSFYRVTISILLSILAGVPLGMAIGRSRALGSLVSPLIYILYPIPKIVFLPIVIVLFGIGDLSKVLMISIIVFFQILVTTRDAAKSICPQIIHSIKSLGAGRLAIYRHVVFPACLPKIFTSLRISLGTAMAVLFLTETYATTQGIGFYIMDAIARFDYPDVFAGVIAMSILGFTLFFILERVERKYCPWKKHS